MPVQNELIPKSFYRGKNHPVATNVDEAIKLLKRLPRDLPIGDEDGSGIRFVVYNNGDEAPTGPFLSLEEV